MASVSKAVQGKEEIGGFGSRHVIFVLLSAAVISKVHLKPQHSHVVTKQSYAALREPVGRHSRVDAA